MAATMMRRPLPALIALVALLVLTAIVWVRVLNRGSASDAKGTGTPCPSSSSSVAPVTVLPNPKTVDVIVLNSTNRSGIAASARTALVAAGFLSTRPAANDNPKTKVSAVAEIRYGPKGASGAQLLRFYFPGARLVARTTDTTAQVTVSLGVAYRGVAPPASVQAGIAAARAKVSGVPSATSSSATCSA